MIGILVVVYMSESGLSFSLGTFPKPAGKALKNIHFRQFQEIWLNHVHEESYNIYSTQKHTPSIF